MDFTDWHLPAWMLATTTPPTMGDLLGGIVLFLILAWLLGRGSPKFATKLAICPTVVMIPLFLFDMAWPRVIPDVAAEAIWLGGTIIVWRLPFWKRLFGEATTDTIHGSAAWSTTADAIAAGHVHKAGYVMADVYGFALGRMADAPAAYDPRWRTGGHILTVAPTGAGKGVSAVIPTLLEYPGATVVLDLKGENYAVTARARRAMGQAVYLVDPFGVTGEPAHGCNLLARIDPAGPDVVAESAALAELLVIAGGKGEDAHFDESARNLLQGMMIYVAALDDPARRHLGEVRRLLTGSEDELLDVFADMAADTALGFGVPARAVNTVMGTGERERGSILSTARRNTAFLDDPRVAAALMPHDVPLADLKRGGMTVYLVLPPARLSAQTRLVRAFFGTALSGITSTAERPPWPVLLMLDEFAQLGYMRQVEDAISLVRGYGACLWLLVQDLSQLRAVYPRWQTFVANTTRQFFGVADFDTAKLISDSLGQATVAFEARSRSQQTGNLRQLGHGSTGTSQQLTGRPLMTPDEVMRLPAHAAVVLTRGEAPYAMTRIDYRTDPQYAGLADGNPYHG